MATDSGTLNTANPTSAELTIGAGETGVRTFIKDIKGTNVRLEINPEGLGTWFYITIGTEVDIPEVHEQPCLREGDIVRLGLLSGGSGVVDNSAHYVMETV